MLRPFALGFAALIVTFAVSSSTAHAQSSGEGEGEGEGAAGEGEGEGAAGEGEGEGAAGEGEGAAGEGEGSAGEGEGEGEGACAGIPPQGLCNGDTLLFCQFNQLIEVDCTQAPYVNAHCADVNPEYGPDCVVPQGGPCSFADPQSPQPTLAACEGGPSAACQVSGANADQSTCVDTSSPCSSADNGSCDGNTFVLCEFLGADQATDGQRLLIDCTSQNATCVPDSAPGSNDGACFQNIGEGEGEGEGAGEGEGEGATTTPPSGSCTCSTASTAAGVPLFALGLVALGGARLFGRRRR